MARYPGNFTDSDILNVPRQLRTRPGNPQVELAYVTPKEQGILQALKPGTPHKGPMGIPNYDEDPYDVLQTGQQYYQSSGGGDGGRPGGGSATTQAAEDYAAAEDKNLYMAQALQELPGFTPTPGGVYDQALQEAAVDTQAAAAVDTQAAAEPDPKDKNLKTPEALLKLFNEKGKKSLTETQLVRIINLLAANKRNKNVLNEKEEEAFSGLFGENYAKNLEEQIQRYREGYPDYFADAEGFNPAMKGLTGLWDSLTAGKGEVVLGPNDELLGRRTLSGLRDDLSTSDKAWLKINRPDLYYGRRTEPGVGNAQTTYGLEELAGIDAQKYGQRFLRDGVTPNPNYNPDFARQIFDARQTLGTEKLRQEQRSGQGVGAGIPSLYAGPITPSDPNAIVTQPGEITYPEGYGSFLLNPPHPVRPGPITTPGFPDADGDGIDDRWQAGPGIARPGIEGTELVTTAAATTPTPFDYSQWPQFDERYPGHYSNWGPSYAANGGVVSQARPQYDYWNKIANAFPGMR